ncbi:ferrochelatase [Variovorax sp. JS1663]|uniref:ferrochelatase n=1 Tax=Variovorax sp. JS1663 TaxID=1851577 RepID=UPI000B349782|nr:ferrochelatase [Variovorax sp. JS1663]OUM00305.1 ferrochelatase [Variovorax sp. JS1663]
MPSVSPAPAAANDRERVAVLWCNLGTPDEPTAAAVRPYLAEFLGDARVVEIPKAVWAPILYGIILRTRPAKSAAKYASIWTPDGSPLKVWTQKQAKLLAGWLGERGHRVTVREAMRYGQPAIAAQLDALQAEGATRILVLQAYPQYSGTTTASVIDAVNAWSARQRRVPEFRFVNDYHDDLLYIEALARSVEAHWKREGRPDRLLLSFHGIPERNIRLGDPYQAQCLSTARLLAARLGLEDAQYQVSFQSRFGRAKWLEPYTEPTLRALGRAGLARVDVLCPGFPADCLETLEEIAMEGRDAFLQSGGKEFRYIPCLNDSPAWIDALCALAERHLSGWPTRDEAQNRPR